MSSKNRRNRKRTQSRPPARQGPAGRPTPEVPEVRTLLVEQQVEAHYGPLPPADMLGDYDARFPGLAERIIRMAEAPLEMAQSQLAHRQNLERKVIGSDIRARWAGLAAGLIVCIFAIGVGGWLVNRGRSVEGLAAIIAALGAPLGAFIYSERRRREELGRKNPFPVGQ